MYNRYTIDLREIYNTYILQTIYCGYTADIIDAYIEDIYLIYRIYMREDINSMSENCQIIYEMNSGY